MAAKAGLGAAASGAAFKVLRSIHHACHKSDERHERVVSLRHVVEAQKLTFEAYLNKKLVNVRPFAHLKIGDKNVRHPMGWVATEHV